MPSNYGVLRLTPDLIAAKTCSNVMGCSKHLAVVWYSGCTWPCSLWRLSPSMTIDQNLWRSCLRKMLEISCGRVTMFPSESWNFRIARCRDVDAFWGGGKGTVLCHPSCHIRSYPAWFFPLLVACSWISFVLHRWSSRNLSISGISVRMMSWRHSYRWFSVCGKFLFLSIFLSA